MTATNDDCRLSSCFKGRVFSYRALHHIYLFQTERIAQTYTMIRYLSTISNSCQSPEGKCYVVPLVVIIWPTNRSTRVNISLQHTRSIIKLCIEWKLQPFNISASRMLVIIHVQQTRELEESFKFIN
jgi:hypothetical protein